MIRPLQPISWPRAPERRLGLSGTYFVTAGTYLKTHRFRENSRLEVLHRGLLAVASEFGWHLEAWSVFLNHYHFIGVSPDAGAASLSPMLGKLHTKTSVWLNRLDGTPGRKVWHNFRETLLTFETSYFPASTTSTAMPRSTAWSSKPSSIPGAPRVGLPGRQQQRSRRPSPRSPWIA